jgi:UDP-N-acetyl-D-galactosamine dehydrogenase
MEQKLSLCIVGLGYVGLPLAHAFAKKGYTTSGYDISEKRIEELKEGHDRTLELSKEQLAQAPIHFSNNPDIIGNADVVIMALPTPIDEVNNPDMTILFEATKTVGQFLKKGAIVVYESTVYPGVTEELCGPILEKESGLVCGKDFFLGYSPERINPGDKKHTVETIIKVVAGQDEKTTDTLCDLYGSIVSAGIHRAQNIKVAEMAKAIENAQRDLNIAYVNEIAMLCHRIGLNTNDVLSAAGTKWNFLPFRPGLVGGHCIGVDPYYLVEKAKQLGIHTHVISAGRMINDAMGAFVADEVVATLKNPADARVLVLGLTFKEDVPDTRNSKVHDVIKTLQKNGVTVETHDPFVKDTMPGGTFDALLLLVAHKQYRTLPLENIVNMVKPGGLLYDLKGCLNQAMIEEMGRLYRSL